VVVISGGVSLQGHTPIGHREVALVDTIVAVAAIVKLPSGMRRTMMMHLWLGLYFQK